MTRRIELVVLAIAVALTLAARLSGACAAHEPHATIGPSDEWYELAMAGQPCGWMHSWQREIPPDAAVPPRIASGQEMMMRLSRSGHEVKVRTKLEVIECLRPEDAGTTRGLVSATLETELGGAPTIVSYSFADARVMERTQTPRRTLQRELDLPAGEWIGPVRAQIDLESARVAGTSPASVTTLDFQSGMRLTTITITRVDGDPAHDGLDDPDGLQWWSTRDAVSPVVTREAYDKAGELARVVIPMELGEVTATRSTKERALQSATGGGIDIIARSMVPIRGGEARTINRATTASFRVNREVPASAQQRVERTADAWVVTVAAAQSGASGGVLGSGGSLSEAERTECLAASILIDKDDPKVQEATTRALSDGKASSDADRSEQLRRMAYRVIRRKDLATAFASASDAIVTRAGDCTEHAVLLAALLRAAGIPSRVACGVVAAESFGGERDVFAWHMWTQAWLDGRWVDLDATLPDRAFHPGHILCATSSLSGGALDPALAELTTVIGGLTIEVIRVE